MGYMDNNGVGRKIQGCNLVGWIGRENLFKKKKLSTNLISFISLSLSSFLFLLLTNEANYPIWSNASDSRIDGIHPFWILQNNVASSNVLCKTFAVRSEQLV